MDSPFVPTWLGVTVGAVAMLIVAAHAMSLRSPSIPASRRRIRQANAGLIVVLVPLLVAGTSLLTPKQNPALWMQVLIAAMLLLPVVIGFALLDIINTARLNRHRKAALAAERDRLEREAAAAVERARGARGGNGTP